MEAISSNAAAIELRVIHYMYLRTGNFDNERNKRWVTASRGLERVEALMIPTVQGLGLLDCKLMPEDARFERLADEEKSTIEESMMLTERFMLSSLWVIGAYELVRTIDQRSREDNIFVVGKIAECVKVSPYGSRLRICDLCSEEHASELVIVPGDSVVTARCDECWSYDNPQEFVEVHPGGRKDAYSGICGACAQEKK